MTHAIRKFHDSDSKRCRQIMKECFAGPVILEPEKKQAILEVFLKDDYFKDASKRFPFFVYEEDGKVYGMGGYEGEEIKRIFVDPAMHGKGIGGEMLGKLEELALADGAKRLVLHPFDNSIGFYKKRGYKEVGEFEFLVSGIRIVLPELVKTPNQITINTP